MAEDSPNITKQDDEPKSPVKSEPQTATEPVKTGAKTFTQEDVDRLLKEKDQSTEQIIKDRLERAKKKAEADAEKARQDAEAEAAKKSGDWQKLAEQREVEIARRDALLAEKEALIKAKEIAELKRTVAGKVGLPLELAARLIGETEKDIETDAKALLETLPKPAEQKKHQPGLAPLNPGASGSTEETDAQKLARIHGSTSNPFNANDNRRRGGGVVHSGQEGGQ